MPPPIPFGSSFNVSTQNTNNQFDTSVTVLADGRMVVVWQDFSANAGDIKMRILNADGSPDGPERTVNAARTGTQQTPEVAALTGGGFAIAWTDSNAAGGDVRFRVYGADGVATTGERAAPATTTGVQQGSTIAATGDGGFVIGWWDTNTATTGLPSSSGAMARAFDATGNGIAGPSRISGDWGGDSAPVFAFGVGGFVAVWDDDLGPDATRNGEDGIYVRLVNGAFPTGNFPDGGIRVDTGAFRESGRNPDIALTVAPAVVATWEDRINPATDTYDIFMSFDGAAPVRVNTTTAGDQVDAHVAALAGGGFVVVWTDRAPGDFGNIRARVFDFDGNPTSADFLVTSGAATEGVQYGADVQALIDGRFVVTWATDGSARGVEARIFDPRTTPIDFLGDATGQQIYGTNFGPGSGFLGDILGGGGGNDSIFGLGGGDAILGGNGSDVLHGDAGRDTLTGGAGADRFVFDVAAIAANADRIEDFSAAQGDRIVLDDDIFRALGPSVGAAEFRLGTAADAADRLVYDRTSGRLWYDRDGTGAAQKVLVATLDPGTALGLGQFEIQI